MTRRCRAPTAVVQLSARLCDRLGAKVLVDAVAAPAARHPERMGVPHRLRVGRARAGVVPLLHPGLPVLLKSGWGCRPAGPVLWLLPWSLARWPALPAPWPGWAWGCSVDSLQVAPETRSPPLAPAVGGGAPARKGGPDRSAAWPGLAGPPRNASSGLKPAACSAMASACREPLLRQPGLHTLLAQTLVTALHATDESVHYCCCSWRRQGAI